jgi:four helix bundle protein
MRDHTKLKAFQFADNVALATYKLTASFPREEMYGLTSQMRRAAVSVPSNIVEGCARFTQAEYIRFLDVAFGSLRELRYQFSLACRLGYCQDKDTTTEFETLLIETEKVLNGLICSLRQKG